METLLGRYKNLIVLAAILFAQLIALAVQVRRPSQDGEMRLIRVWAIAAVTPLEKAVVHSQTWVHDKWVGYVWLRNVRRENEQLRADIERMKLEQARLNEDANMARRIQTLLAFKEQYIENTVAAQVIGTSGSEIRNPPSAKMFAIHRIASLFSLGTNRSRNAPTSGVKRMMDKMCVCI